MRNVSVVHWWLMSPYVTGSYRNIVYSEIPIFGASTSVLSLVLTMTSFRHHIENRYPWMRYYLISNWIWSKLANECMAKLSYLALDYSKTIIKVPVKREACQNVTWKHMKDLVHRLLTYVFVLTKKHLEKNTLCHEEKLTTYELSMDNTCL